VVALVNYGSILLPTQCDTTEGVAIRLADLLINVNDGFYHTGASLLNAGVEARCMPPCPLQFSINATLGLVGGTTGTDCLLEFGTPLRRARMGHLPNLDDRPQPDRQHRGERHIAAIDAGRRGAIHRRDIGAHPRLLHRQPAVGEVDDDVWVDGTLIGTHADECQGGIMTAGSCGFGTSKDNRSAPCVSMTSLFAGPSNRVNMEGYRADRRR
jgi:hypothetical protein